MEWKYRRRRAACHGIDELGPDRPTELRRARARVLRDFRGGGDDRFFRRLAVRAVAHAVAERLLHQPVLAAVEADDRDPAGARYEQMRRDRQQPLEVPDLAVD